MKKNRFKKFLSAILTLTCVLTTFIHTVPVTHEAMGYISNVTILDWPVSENESAGEKAAREMWFILDNYNDFVYGNLVPEILTNYPEYSDWFQYITAIRLCGVQDDWSIADELFSKKAVLKYAQKNGYWKDDYVAPFEKWDLEAMKNTYYITEMASVDPLAWGVNWLDGTTRFPTDYRVSDYEVYAVARACGVFTPNSYTPSTCKYDLDSYEDVGTKAPIKYGRIMYQKNDGTYFTDDDVNKKLASGGVILVTEEQYEFIKDMDYNEFSEFLGVCCNTTELVTYGWGYWKQDTGWPLDGEPSEAVLEYLAEIGSPALKKSAYSEWYGEWLKTYESTSGNWELINSIVIDYDKWYSDWLKENRPGITLETQPRKTQNVPTPTPEPEYNPTDKAEELSRENSTDGHTHEYVPNIILEPGCETEGQVEYVCECGDVISDVLPLLGHLLVITDSEEATCTSGGYTISTCDRCGDTFSDNTDPLGHDWQVTEIIEASCENEGCIKYHCDQCGEDYEETTEKLDHLWQIVETVGATCSHEGSETSECQNCGECSTDIIARLNHTEATRVKEEAAFFKKGIEETYCTECGEVLKESPIESGLSDFVSSDAHIYVFGGAAVVIAALLILVLRKRKRFN